VANNQYGIGRYYLYMLLHYVQILYNSERQKFFKARNNIKIQYYQDTILSRLNTSMKIGFIGFIGIDRD